jgi:hypothetical protein
MGGEAVGFLKIVLWILLFLFIFAPTSSMDTQDKWRVTIGFCVVLICLTWLYK